MEMIPQPPSEVLLAYQRVFLQYVLAGAFIGGLVGYLHAKYRDIGESKFFQHAAMFMIAGAVGGACLYGLVTLLGN